MMMISGSGSGSLFILGWPLADVATILGTQYSTGQKTDKSKKVESRKGHARNSSKNKKGCSIERNYTCKTKSLIIGEINPSSCRKYK